MSQRIKAYKRTTRIFIYMYVLMVLLSLLVVASYTWFSLSRTPRVSDMYMFINSMSGLEISTDPKAEEWQLQLDFRDMVDITTPLRPVTWSERNQRFYAARYGADGRLMEQSTWHILTDSQNANTLARYGGYYIKTTFYARTGQNEKVFLSPAVEVDEGLQGSGTYLIGTPVWNSQQILHNNGGQGAECAVRIGIRVTPVDLEGVPNGVPGTFYIYEPNCDLHIDGTTGYVPTPSIDQTESLVPADRLILQTASTWTEAYPVQRDVVVRELGDFTTDTELFALKAGEMVMIDLYVWLEGQDVDCTNQINGAQILASIQLDTVVDTQSGLVPIE